VGYVQHFFWLAQQGLQVGIYLFPSLTFLAAAGLVAAAAAAAFGPKLPWRNWAWLCLPFLVPVVILAYGVAFAYAGPIGTAPAWRGLVVVVLIWSHVPIGLAFLALDRKNPLVPIGLTGFQMWLSFCMGVMSSMSATNIWL
jgi:hypothetical protein